MASMSGRLIHLWVVVGILVCLSHLTSGGNYRKRPKPAEYERPCPYLDSGSSYITEDDETGRRCCYENNYFSGRVTSSYKYCNEEPGCCGEHGKLYCCYTDKLTVYLAIGLTLGALALLGIIAGILVCCLCRSSAARFCKGCCNCKSGDSFYT